MGLTVPSAPTMGDKKPPNAGAAPPPPNSRGSPDPPPNADLTASTWSTPDSAPLGRGTGSEYTRPRRAASRGGERKDNATTPHAELDSNRRGIKSTPLRPTAPAERDKDNRNGRLTTPLCSVSRSPSVSPKARAPNGSIHFGTLGGDGEAPNNEAASSVARYWQRGHPTNQGRGGDADVKRTGLLGRPAKKICPSTKNGPGRTRPGAMLPRKTVTSVSSVTPLAAGGGWRMVWNIICLPSPLLKQEGGGGRWVDGLLRVAEIRTERRMEPADEGEGIYRFASVGKS